MKKRVLSIIVATLLLAAASSLLTGCGASVDYVASVKALKPYEDYGVTASYGTVVSKLISSARWQERVQSKELAFVDISGKMDDVDGSSFSVALTIRITPYEGKTAGMLWFEPHIVEIDGKSYGSDAANEFVNDLFTTYDDKLGSVADYYATLGIDSIALYFFREYR